MLPVKIVVEDHLSASVLSHLLDSASRGFAYDNPLGLQGNTFIHQNLRRFNRAAAGGLPFVVLTDLDDRDCPPNLLKSWLGGKPDDNLIFGVAVREVEAWLIADSAGLSKFLSVPQSQIPESAEDIEHPKEFLVDLARQSGSISTVSDLVPRKGSTAKVGRNYNGALIKFVENGWDPHRACSNSLSLKRMMQRLATFSPKWSP